MSSGYKTIHTGGTGEIEEKKSRFIAQVENVHNEEEATAFLDSVRKRHYSARHNCYAYVTGHDPEIVRSSDDGEPSGTAGRPILEVIKGAELHDVIIVVTRYFGGTLLGTGGLVRAYTQAAQAGIDESVVIDKRAGIRFCLEFDYDRLGKLQYILAEKKAITLDTEYGSRVKITGISDSDDIDALEAAIREGTAAQVELQRAEQVYYAVVNGETMIF